MAAEEDAEGDAPGAEDDEPDLEAEAAHAEAEAARQAALEQQRAAEAALAALQRSLRLAVERQGVAEVLAVVAKGAPLLAGYDLDQLGEDTGTALDLAMLHKRFELALRLLRLDAGDAAELPLRCTRAVAWAARDGRLQVLQELLNRGAPMTQCDDQGRSALLLASLRGQGDCVRALLAAGAWEGETKREEVHHWVAHLKLGPLLEEAGADVLPVGGAGDCSGGAAAVGGAAAPQPAAEEAGAGAAALRVRLQFALMRQGVKEVKSLVLQGAPLTAEYDLDELGKGTGTPLDLALAHRRYELAQQLLTMQGEPVGEELARGSLRAVAWAARDGRALLLRELLRLGGDATQCDEKGQSPLLLAATRGQKECLRVLLDAGALGAEAQPDVVRGCLEKLSVPVAAAA